MAERRKEQENTEEMRLAEDGDGELVSTEEVQSNICAEEVEQDIRTEEAEQGIPAGEMQQGVCSCNHYKRVPRDAAGQKQLTNRINRIIGQLNGIRNMIGENRYCGDILIQIGAVESALQSLGYVILQEHMQTCVVEEIKNGNEAVMEEAVELIKRLQ